MLTPSFMAQRKQMMMFHKNRSTLKHRVLCMAPKEEKKIRERKKRDVRREKERNRKERVKEKKKGRRRANWR